MMLIPKAIFFNILLLAACDTNSQQTEEDSLITIVCTFPEYIEAGYPGGISIWQKHVLQFVNPARAKRKGAPAGFYQVEVAFLIKKDGSIDSVKALSNNGFGMERKVIKAIRKTSRWTPAIRKGRNISEWKRHTFTLAVGGNSGSLR